MSKVKKTEILRKTRIESLEKETLINNDNNKKLTEKKNAIKKIKFKIPKEINFKITNMKCQKFKIYNDNLLHLKSSLFKELHNNIWMKFDNDDLTDEEEINSEKKKMRKFIINEFKKIQQNKNYLKDNLFRIKINK